MEGGGARALGAPGPGVGSGGPELCFEADAKTVVADQLGSFVRLSKISGGRLLTGIGGDGGAEGWMVLCALRHHTSGVRNRWLCGLHGLRWLHRRLLGPSLPLLL